MTRCTHSSRSSWIALCLGIVMGCDCVGHPSPDESRPATDSANSGLASSSEEDSAPGSETGLETGPNTGGDVGSNDNDNDDETEASNATDDEGDEFDDHRFDLGALPDAHDAGDKKVEFAFIWIANSPEGTVSKIDTRTRVEVGRYRTGPDSPRRPDPSRTSVGMHGDVAVVNRGGGIVRIQAVDEHCEDRNGNGRIDSSRGPDDVYPWGADECVAWHLALPRGSRPAAWTPGDKQKDADGNDVWVDAKIWTSAPLMNTPPLPPMSDVAVYLIDGDTGIIDDEVVIPQIAHPPLGLYGGAVDSAADLWTLTMEITPGGSHLVHVPLDDLNAYRLIEIPSSKGYGITVDSEDRVWVGCMSGGSLQRYDPTDDRWTEVLIDQEGSDRWAIRGMMEDAHGHLWAAVAFGGVFVGQGGGLLRVDTGSASFVEFIGASVLTDVTLPTGASIDIDGQIWMVDERAAGGGAFVYEPESGTAEFVGGLNGPYTYSDMTGWALANVTGDPPGR